MKPAFGFRAFGNAYIYIVVLVANFNSFCTGSLGAWSSTATSKLSKLDDNPLGYILSNDELSLLASLPNIGTIVGYFLFGQIIDRCGRRIAILLTAFPGIICQLLLTFVPDLNWYYVAKTIGGLSQSGTYFVIPVFTGEISPSEVRGFLSSFIIIFLYLGMLFSYSIGPYVPLETFNAILLIPPAILLVGTVLLIPETPHYYVYNKDDFKAKAALIHIRGTTDIEGELEDIKKNANVEKASFIEMFKDRAGRKAFFIALTANLAMNFSGIGPILSYTQSIFETTGSDIDPAVSSIILGAVQLGACLLFSRIVDKWGRRIMLLTSAGGIILSQIVFGIYYYLKDNDNDVQNVSWLPLVSLIALLIFLSFGVGPLPSIIVGELFPINFKADGILILSSIGIIVGFFLTFYYNNMADQNDGIGTGPTMWLYSGVLTFLSTCIYFFFFETKGKTLQEIQDILNA